jgi:uncharacterized membrane protein YdbT with pleckstrin-like domain
MFEALRGWLLPVLRVSPEPSPPAGDRALRTFRAAPNFFRYRLAFWGLGQLGAVAGLVFGLILIQQVQRATGSPLVITLTTVVEILAWLAFLVQLPFSLAALRLDFDLRWYLLSERALRVREGIFTVREKTMTYANIQQITIEQNPLQRLLGISDVQVRSAGGGAVAKSASHPQVGEGMHEAYFRGVADAEGIREEIRERVRRFRDAGLGDPDDASAMPAEPAREDASREGAGTGDDDSALGAARVLHEELRDLRRQLATRGA